MANYPAITIPISSDGVSIYFLDPNTCVLSGTVKDSEGNPLRRYVMAFVYPRLDLAQTTESDVSDGTWSITLNAGPTDRIIALCFGESAGENSEIFDWLTTG